MSMRYLFSTVFSLAIVSAQATTWTPVNFIDQQIGVQSPKVSASPAGNAIATWTSNVNGDILTYAASYTPLTDWGLVTALSAGGGSSNSASCNTDPVGNGLAIWAKQSSFTPTAVIQASYMPVLTRLWSTSTTISATNQVSISPAFGFNPSTGNGLAIWNNLSTGQIEGSFFTALLVNWSAPFAISDTAVDLRGLQVAVAPNGKIIVMWQEYNIDLDTYNLKSRIYTGSSWLPITTFDDVSSSVAKNCLGMDNSGNALATWYDVSLGTLKFATCAAGNTTWTTPADITFPHPIFSLDLVVNPSDGNATLVCITFDGTYEYTEAINYNLSTNSWSTPTIISNLATGYTKNPAVTTDSNSNPVVIWTRYNGTNFVLEMSSFANGNWSPPIALSTSTTALITPDISSSRSLLFPVVHAVWDWFNSSNRVTSIQVSRGSP